MWHPSKIPAHAELEALSVQTNRDGVFVDAGWTWTDGGTDASDPPITSRGTARWQLPPGTDLAPVLEALKPKVSA